jgi:hypothetical protein
MITYEKMRTYKYNFRAVLLLVTLLSTMAFVSCNDEETAKPGVKLLGFGPSPILRGGTLKIVGTGLSAVTEVILPDNVSVTDFTVHTAQEIQLVIPDATVDGKIILKMGDNEIISTTILGISEPISIDTLSSYSIKPGADLKIEGTYLNLITEVVFGGDVVVKEFKAQSREAITVVVPATAKSGKLTISNGKEEPILLTTEEIVVITLPKVTGLNPQPLKPGSNLTIAGTDLDLATEVLFKGGVSVLKANYVSASATSIVLALPVDALEGAVSLKAASEEMTESTVNLAIVAPTITGITANPIKAGNDLTITGTDLDLVKTVEFGGALNGTIKSQSATQIVVTVPRASTSAVVTLKTVAKTVASASTLTLIDPTITSITPLNVKTNENITISGTDLDLVTSVKFVGGEAGTIVSQSATQMVVTVPLTGTSGTAKLSTVNSATVESTESMTITSSELPIISGMPTIAILGSKITLTGEKMTLVSEVKFSGNKYAFKFGAKTATSLEVYVPTGALDGPIELITELQDVVTTASVNVVDPNELSNLIFEESRASAWGDWGWGGAADWANGEKSFLGSISAKKTFDGSWDALRWGGGSVSTTPYTHFVFYAYGGTGIAADSEINLVVNEGWGTPYIFKVQPGQWTEVIIPIASVNGGLASWTDIMYQGRGTNGSVYFDHIGFK